MRIPKNRLLHDDEKTMDLDQALLLKVGLGATSNLRFVSEEQIREIYSTYGESGLFKLVFLAMGHEESDFKHFFSVISDDLSLMSLLSADDGTELHGDRDDLSESPELRKFKWNVMQPSLSRKLYQPGRHHGYMVYGVGGPRILVSHPYQGLSGEVYDIYNNSVDVVTSLWMRGYRGMFMFLDYLPGLNFESEGVPAWALWFSIIACNSDLVVFVKEYEEAFRESQLAEIGFTPDRVLKKVVEVPRDELKWAKIDDHAQTYLYSDGKRMLSREEWYELEAAHARPFVDAYTRDGIPNDRLYVMNEAGDVAEYPQDYPAYNI